MGDLSKAGNMGFHQRNISITWWELIASREKFSSEICSDVYYSYTVKKIGIFGGYIYGHDEGGCNNHIALYNGDVVEVSVTTHCWDDFCALDI